METDAASAPETDRLRRALLVTWFLLAPAAMLLTGRHVWEQTLLTWERGPQMIGYSFRHFHPFLGILGVLAFWLGHVWLALFASWVVRGVARRRRVDAGLTFQAFLLGLTVALGHVPYEQWKWWTLEFKGAGPGGGALLTNAAGHGDLAFVRALLDHGIEVNSPAGDDRVSALMSACAGGEREVAELLLARGADPNLRDRKGKTALMRAVEKGDAPLVRALLARGAAADVADHGGTTALDRATTPEVERLLREAGARPRGRR